MNPIASFARCGLLLLLVVFARPACARAGMVTLTFDDGLASVAQNALPILQKYGLPAVAGVIVSKLESDDPDYMRVKDLARLQKAGWEIASHSLTHRRCRDLPGEYGREIIRNVRPDPRLPGVYDAAYEYPALAGLLCDGAPMRRVAERPKRGLKPGAYYYDEETRNLYVRPLAKKNGAAPELRAVSYERELSASRDRLAAYGFAATSFIAPFDDWSVYAREDCAKYYAQAAAGGEAVNPRRGTDRLWLRRYNIGADTSLEEVKRIVRAEAMEKDGWVIFCLHGVGEGAGWEPVSEEKLEDIARFLQQSGVAVVTLDQGAKRFFGPSAGMRQAS